MENIKQKRYLKMQSGISLEVLIKKFDKYNIQYELETLEGTGKYFRDSIVRVRKPLIDLFNNHNIIPNVQLKQLNIEENFIELNATYNFLIALNGIYLKIDEDCIEIIPEYAKKLEANNFVSQPIDRIRIYPL